jgi:hypothetical protein
VSGSAIETALSLANGLMYLRAFLIWSSEPSAVTMTALSAGTSLRMASVWDWNSSMYLSVVAIWWA